MKKLLILTTALLISTAASALDLQTARQEGAVSEGANGYLTAAKPGAEIKTLVDQVNAGRKTEYERISKENGQPVDVVAKLAGQQLMKKN